jgi:hypothetical protein
MSNLHLHHLLEDSAFLVGIAPVDEVTPSHEDEDEQNDDGDENSHEGCAIFSALSFSPAAGIIVTTILAIV